MQFLLVAEFASAMAARYADAAPLPLLNLPALPLTPPRSVSPSPTRAGVFVAAAQRRLKSPERSDRYSPAPPITPGAERARGVMALESTQGKLTELTERFSGFECQIKADAKARKVTQEGSIVSVKATLARIEEMLNAEIMGRTEDHQMLQTSFEAKLAGAQGKLEALFLERFDHIHSLVDALDDRTSIVEKDFTHSRERYVAEMEDESGQLNQELCEFQQGFEEEIADRKLRESDLLEKIRVAEGKAAEKIAHEIQQHDQKYAHLARDAEDSSRAREESQRHFQERAIAEVEAAATSLKSTTKAREQADDDIVIALNHYTQALQGALCTVSQGVLHAAKH